MGIKSCEYFTLPDVWWGHKCQNKKSICQQNQNSCDAHENVFKDLESIWMKILIRSIWVAMTTVSVDTL